MRGVLAGDDLKLRPLRGVVPEVRSLLPVSVSISGDITTRGGWKALVEEDWGLFDPQI